jgi:DNA-binding IscR family transcriptional regulator
MAGQRCLTHGLWDALGDQIAAFLESVTLLEVIEGIPVGKQPVRVAPPVIRASTE